MNYIGKAVQLAINAKAKQHIFSAAKVCSRYSSGSIKSGETVLPAWNKYWKPGPYPRTEEERRAAAKKYNMLYEDYEPYPEEEAYGDYPKIPCTHMENLSDFEEYDYYPVYKRNYGEVMHPDFDMCIEDRVNFQKEQDPPLWKMYLRVFLVGSIFVALILYDRNHPTNLRMIPKQYPYKGAKSYTFEPAD